MRDIYQFLIAFMRHTNVFLAGSLSFFLEAVQNMYGIHLFRQINRSGMTLRLKDTIDAAFQDLESQGAESGTAWAKSAPRFAQTKSSNTH